MLFTKDINTGKDEKDKYTSDTSAYTKPRDNMTKRKKWILMQVLVWIIYWLVELFMLSLVSTINQSLWLETITNLFCGTLFFYALLFFVLPPARIKIDIPTLILGILIIIVGCTAIRWLFFFLMSKFMNLSTVILPNYKYFFVSSFDIFLKFGTFAGLVWFFLNKTQLQKEMFNKQLEEERLQNELLIAKQATIKAQINPHFLFNTLHYIHSKALASNDENVSQTILLLSDVLRHSLKDYTGEQLVSINEELAHIKKLYAINKMRFNGKHYFDIIEKGSTFNKNIPPFILLTFFENALKHGVFDEVENPACLNIHQSTSFTQISLSNKIKPKEEINIHEQFAIGKQYIQNALERFYKNNYILEYHNNTNFHTVDLKIYG